MDSSALNQKSNFHARSNSLPSRPHPLIPQIDELLCRLRSNEAATSSSSINEKLNGLRDLYELVHSFLQLPNTQKSLAQNRNDNELLNGSLKLLDACGLVKDTLLQAKDDTQQLQSVLRRRRGGDARFANEAKAYLASRKKANKLINKSLRDLKISKYGFADVEATISMLRDVEGVTFKVLQSVLSYITASMPEPKWTGWSLVLKLMQSKRVTCEGQASSATNEFERVNAILCSLIGSKTETENAQNELQKLESSIEDVEEEVEGLIRVLIKARVSILNILSH
ncbi:putative serine/threonine-protein kinase [Hibiscus syriacus]|uniref:Serine/threonine-protein kinase n=1 Tax=Hibiscus syriacus TaxID=106335 RepID=A0A6A2WXB1_HIBSY|nr:uncharacterized protein LOC120197300 [Hibiscus syriacus]KAE8654356.1 putative serine/threonine-protein kinase [Hibiscus syriacus]